MDSTKKMKRSKSLSCLGSIDMEMYKLGSEEWGVTKSAADSGVKSGASFGNLEKKVDKLFDMCMEQNRVVSELTEHVRNSGKNEEFNEQQMMEALGELLKKLVEQREKNESFGEGTAARSLLSALEARPSLERRIGDALTNLLQSEDFKQRIVSSTAAAIKQQIRSLFSVEVSSLYVPIMERAHRQLLGHVTNVVAAAFTDLEESTASNTEALRQTSQTLQTALQHHQALLQEACQGADRLVDAVASTTENVLERELQLWREEMSLATPQAASECDSGRVDSPSPAPSACDSPERSAGSTGGSPALTAVDRMMIKAEINKLIKDGDVNGAFTKALLAMDLELVTVACRAAAPALPTRPALAQTVLLSLVQQLATDLTVDTQLKCSYIEYALQNLDLSVPATRAHLPFVVSELVHHISAFFRKYPRHALCHRISFIAVTARHLL